MESPEGTNKMHRIITSEDVMEYPMHVPPRDVQLIKEDDIEYRDGRLVKSNGTTRVSVDQPTSYDDISPDEDGETDYPNVFNVSGSYTMKLKACKFVPQATRRRRSFAQRNLDSDSSSEENLMASFDQSEK